jgi:hypothetical protein
VERHDAHSRQVQVGSEACSSTHRQRSDHVPNLLQLDAEDVEEEAAENQEGSENQEQRQVGDRQACRHREKGPRLPTQGRRGAVVGAEKSREGHKEQ